MKNKTTVIKQVRAALMNGERVSSLDAYKLYGAQHLASTIRTLRKEGMAIDTNMILKHKGNGRAVRWAQYTLAGCNDARA